MAAGTSICFYVPLAGNTTAAEKMGRPVSNVTIAALIVAGSGLAGGLLAATAARSVERFRISAALLEKPRSAG